MTIAAQLLQVAAALDAWARALEKGGYSEVASDPFHLLGLLSLKPGNVRATVLFTTETKRGEHEEASMVDRSFAVIISRGRGMTLEPSASLVKGNAGGQPLFGLVESARDVVRGLSFASETTEVTPNYTGTEIFAVDGKAIDAYQLNFQIGTILPVPPQPET